MAYTDQHTSSGFGTLVLKQYHVFNASVTPQTLDVEIGQTAMFTCAIYPPLPSTSSDRIMYRWFRVDDGKISNNARGTGTHTLRIVSSYVGNIKYYSLKRDHVVNYIFILYL